MYNKVRTECEVCHDLKVYVTLSDEEDICSAIKNCKVRHDCSHDSYRVVMARERAKTVNGE